MKHQCLHTNAEGGFRLWPPARQLVRLMHFQRAEHIQEMLYKTQVLPHWLSRLQNTTKLRAEQLRRSSSHGYF